MSMVVGVRFQENGKIYDFDPGELTLLPGEMVVVETARGIECGIVARANRTATEEREDRKPVLRRATAEDRARHEENRQKAREAMRICQERIAAHGLEMKLVDAEYAFDNSKITFNFTADGRVDFRNLVKDLAATLHTRIELHQIGVRDEAKKLGGIGICGQPFCCSRFLREFQPVSIKMAKEQGLSLNPTKISGSCGRLMCCLKHEQDTYEALIKMSPKVGSVVTIPEGRGVVVESNILTGKVKVRLEDASDSSVVETTRDIINGVVPEPEDVPAAEEIPVVESPVAEPATEEKPAPKQDKPHHKPHHGKPQQGNKSVQGNKPQGDKPAGNGERPAGRPNHHRRGHHPRNKRQG
ncbi:MAG: stage 0 sporulation protein [Clostridia bacterium]|nr:stage 0 sporulation protein [Clostridia bacterium]